MLNKHISFFNPGISVKVGSIGCGDSFSTNDNQGGPEFHKELVMKSDGHCPLERESAGLSSDRTCFHVT